MSKPVALLMSMFERNFKTFSFWIDGITNFASAGSFAWQNAVNLTRFVFFMGSFNFDATFTKKKIIKFICDTCRIFNKSVCNFYRPNDWLSLCAFTCTKFLQYLINTTWIVLTYCFQWMFGIELFSILNHSDNFISPKLIVIIISNRFMPISTFHCIENFWWYLLRLIFVFNSMLFYWYMLVHYL